MADIDEVVDALEDIKDALGKKQVAPNVSVTVPVPSVSVSQPLPPVVTVNNIHTDSLMVEIIERDELGFIKRVRIEREI